MTQTSQEIERDVEARRAHVEETLHALRERMSFGQIIDEVTRYVPADQSRIALQNAGRQLRDNPLALGLIGAGIAWLMFGDGAARRAGSVRERFAGDGRERIPGEARRYGETRYGSDYGDYTEEDELQHTYASAGYSSAAPTPPMPEAGGPGTRYGGGNGSGTESRSRLSDAADRAGSAASSMAGSARSTAASARSSMSGTASATADRLGEAGEAVGESARAAYARTRDAAWQTGNAAYESGRRFGAAANRYGRQATHSATSAFESNPLVVGAIAVAVGAAIGAALPRTRTEDEWFGEARDRLRDDAVDYARKRRDDAADVAAKAYGAAKAEAKEQNLAPSGEGPTAAEKVEKVASAAASTAKQEAKKKS